MHVFRTLCLILCCLFLAGVTHAQERSTNQSTDQSPPPGTDFSSSVRSNMQATASKLKQPCGSHAHGSEWSEACDTGLTGSVARICVHGESVIKSISCQRDPTSCGAHTNGETWTGSCGGSLLGNVTYECQSGNTVINSSSCTLPYSCANGSTYSVSCPSGMSGSLTYTCNNDALSITNSTCQTITADCGGGHANGSSWNASCPNGLAGNVTYQCMNGTSAITAINCTVAGGASCSGYTHGATWEVNCPSPYIGSVTYKCFDGTAAIKQMSCAAETFDTTQDINRNAIISAAKTYGGYAPGLQITGVDVGQAPANAICATALGAGNYALSWGTFTFSTSDNETILYWTGSTFAPANAKALFGSNHAYLNTITCARNKTVTFTN